jgi:hypothetical protein
MGDVFILVYNFHVPLALKVGCPSSDVGCDVPLVLIFLCVGLMEIFLWCCIFLRIPFCWCAFRVCFVPNCCSSVCPGSVVLDTRQNWLVKRNLCPPLSLALESVLFCSSVRVCHRAGRVFSGHISSVTAGLG